MALIIEALLSTAPLPIPPEKAVRACLEVRKINLSEAYELPNDAIVTGEILKVEGGGLTDEEKGIVKEIEGKEIEFILWVAALGSIDRLYISSDSWLIFRDYAILPEMGFRIRVKLTEAKYDEETVEIFPKRDVIEE